MRRTLGLIALTIGVNFGVCWAGPAGSGSGPITVDSTTFAPGQSVMGTDGGVYSDTLPPIASTTTAAFRMTKYRALHVNLRDNAGGALGVSGNPLYTTGVTTVTIGAVTVTNSSFSVTGSTVQTNIIGTVPVSGTFWQSTQPVSIAATVNTNATSVNVSTVTISGTPSVNISGAIPAGTNNVGTVTGSTVTVSNTVNTKQVNVSTVIVTSMPPVTVSLSTVTITNSSFSIVGISSVNVVNTPNVNVMNTPAVTVSGALPAGGNNIGTVTGSTISISNTGFAVTNAPNVNVANVATVVGTQTNPANLRSSVSIDGGSNTVKAVQSGAWSVTASSFSINGSTISVNVIGTVPVSGTFWQTTQPVSVTNVTTTTVSGTVAATQSGNWTNAVTQSMNSNLRASCAIDGSSNTVQITGTPSVNSTLQTGTNTIGKINFATPTTTVFSSTTINISTTGDNTIVGAVAAQTVRVFRIFFVVSAATTVTIKDGTGLSLTGAMTFSSGGSFVIDFAGDPWFVTSSGNGFVINQSGTAQISGRVYWTQS